MRVPADEVEAVLAVGRERERAEVEVIRRLRGGARTLDLMGLREPVAGPTRISGPGTP
ncbi:hypothetical protein LWP59_26605 [Amycolatopsis acidiphila]|uniref:hypothetical protein n=1 Tax=Amycolatopsis acidiphila TaxID=715473 RepID=UPI001643D3CB|nr:hypothetical protein [Amycolatopsis acidiphila]UIJ57701.1 hypothetical protein LWP59_26605 [Amycolatopsis acidiphila]GHG95259.1 hypothetical protein GCM10017788_73550 [Amycolatopsis acidiphila]